MGVLQGELRRPQAAWYSLIPGGLRDNNTGIITPGEVYIRSWRTLGYTPHPKHATSTMTQALPLPPLEVLQEKFEYNPERGVLTRRSNNQTAGYSTQRGWLRVKVGGTHYRVHRIAWKMFYGEDPPEGLDIDHINRDKTDNRISNLRVVTRKDNVANSARVLFKKPLEPLKTPEELAEIRRKAAKKNMKAIVVRLPNGEERWYPSIKEAASSLDILPPGISQVLRGTMKQYKGYTARYA